MKTKIISIVVMLMVACNVMGEDLVYVYMKNGKCGFFPVSVLSSMKVSKVDAVNTQHSDYRTQTIITSDTTLSISLSEIDSIVFVNKEVKPFPNTESEIRESIDLTNRIAEETNLRMDSLKEVGITDICIILDEIRRIDGVVFADVSTTQSIIHIIQTDGICINHLLNTCKLIPNEDYEQEITQLKGSALSPHRMNEIEENESIFIPQQGKALILAPFQDFFYKQINYWKEQLGRLYDVEDYVFLNEKADITKFKGDYLSQFDFILIDTHGANETLEVLKSDKDNLWYKKTFELYAPEKFTTALASRTEYSYDTVDDLVNKTKKLSWNQIILVHEDESKEVYLAMDKSFIEGHSFDGKIVFASACQSAKDRTSSTSLMKAFIDNGATIYIGFRETISPALAGDFNNGLLGFLTHGVSFGDFNKYWINSKYVAKVKESAIDCKYNEPIETLDPNLYTYKINPKYENYEIFLKNPYPSLNLPVIENGEIIFEWNTELEECSTIVHSIEEENDNFYSLNYNFTFKLNSDLYIDGNLYKHIIGKKNISVPVAEFSAGGHKWQISCYLEDSYGDKVCTYSSVLQDFTIPEPLQNLVISQNNVVVNPGSTTTVEITSGNGDYTVSVDKSNIATAILSGTTITITGVAAGTAKVTVKDKSGQTAEIIVTVSSSSGDCPVAEAIDLGLPSGTLWASWNVGASSPEEYGGYYAWGETEEKEVYDWSTYTHCDGSAESFHHIGDDIAGTEYDVAHVKWGNQWNMPSLEQFWELENNCTISWTNQNGVNGTLVTGPNGNSIFLPAGGDRREDNHNYEGTRGVYWTSTYSPNHSAYYYILTNGDMYNDRGICSRGYTIRPVVSPSKPKPDCPVAEAIDLGLPSGTKWASWNIGASSPEDFGGYYAWGETEEKEVYSEDTYKYYNSETNEYIHIGDDIAGTEYDVAHVKWGSSWRMPSVDQVRELLDNCTRTWTQQNGVNGTLVTGPNGNTIFLPAAGYRWLYYITSEDEYGNYWSSSLSPSVEHFAYILILYLNNRPWSVGSRYEGYSVRAVCP